MIKLTNLFESLLLEDKREHVIATYGEKLAAALAKDTHAPAAGIDKVEQLVDKLNGVSPKHLVWVARMYGNGVFRVEDLPRVKSAVDRFEVVRSKLEKKDLNAYKDLADVEDAVETIEPKDAVSNRARAEQLKTSGSEKMLETEEFVVVRLDTVAAAKFYGKGTKWCTAGEQYNMFRQYRRDGPIYVIIDKANNRKYQFHEASEQFMDEKDRNVSARAGKELIKRDQRLFEFVIKKYKHSMEWLTKTEVRAMVDTIKDDADMMLKIANKLRMRLPEHEHKMATSRDGTLLAQYAWFAFEEGRWPEAEKNLLARKSLATTIEYASHIERWPELEKKLNRGTSPSVYRAIATYASSHQVRSPKFEQWMVDLSENEMTKDTFITIELYFGHVPPVRKLSDQYRLIEFLVSNEKFYILAKCIEYDTRLIKHAAKVAPTEALKAALSAALHEDDDRRSHAIIPLALALEAQDGGIAELVKVTKPLVDKFRSALDHITHLDRSKEPGRSIDRFQWILGSITTGHEQQLLKALGLPRWREIR